MDLPLGKKSIFGRNTNFLLKASNRISVSENVPWDTFQTSRGTRDKEIGYERWSQSESWEESFFSGRYFYFKMIPKGLFWHAQISRNKHKCKVPTSKFGHFWPKTMDLPLGKKSIFGRNTNILLKASNRISVSENVPWDSFKASRGTRDKEIAYERWSQSESWGGIFFSGPYFHFKMIPKGVLRHAEISREINRWQIPTSKFGHFWPKTMDLPVVKSPLLDEIQVFF